MSSLISVITAIALERLAWRIYDLRGNTKFTGWKGKCVEYAMQRARYKIHKILATIQNKTLKTRNTRLIKLMELGSKDPIHATFTIHFYLCLDSSTKNPSTIWLVTYFNQNKSMDKQGTTKLRHTQVWVYFSSTSQLST